MICSRCGADYKTLICLNCIERLKRAGGLRMYCPACQGDGWIAYPTWADAEKQVIRIQKVACPRGCPLANPDETGVLPTFPQGATP
jgi:hypothetical protein